jgi:hypothetical protein
MVDQGETRIRRIAIRWSRAAGGLVCLLLFGYVLWRFVLKDSGDYTRIPLDRSPFLRDVAEPITMIRWSSEAASDSVWMGVAFMDEKHVERYVEYVTTSYNAGGMHDKLLLGDRAVAARDPEERALLGLLQRWYRRDAEAPELIDRLRSRGSAQIDREQGFNNLSEQQQAKVIGVGIMKALSRRN